MSEQHFQKVSELRVSRDALFAWHARPGAFERLCPPFDPARVIEQSGGIRDGDRATIALPFGPLSLRWVAEHRGFVPGQQFQDVMLSGPFAAWEHTHRFESTAGGGSRLVDSIRYRLPLGALGATFGAGLVARKLEAAFRWRHRITTQDLELHAALQPGLAAQRPGPWRVLITGASGLVGQNLAALLSTGGHRLVRAVRRAARGPDELTLERGGAPARLADLEDFDAVVHLAGEPIAQRWTKRARAAIETSRVEGTRQLVAALTALARPPRVLISASAIGFYGERGDDLVDERHGPGTGFLADLAGRWEQAADPARAAGMRVLHPRFGLILSPRGGALAKTLPAARLGLGGPLGSGRHWWSWVSLEDATAALLFALATKGLEGPFNVVAPEPVRQADFMRVLGAVLRRPAFLPAPAFALRLAFGEMADAALLASVRVAPTRLQNHGFRFRDPGLEACLRAQLGRWT